MKEQHAHGHWGKFNDALAALDKVLDPRFLPPPNLPKEAFETWEVIRTMARHSMRFYVPCAATAILSYGSTVCEPARLPYEVVMVLSEDFTITPKGTTLPIWKISLASEVPAGSRLHEGDMYLWGATCVLGEWSWMPFTVKMGLRSGSLDKNGSLNEELVYTLTGHNQEELLTYLVSNTGVTNKLLTTSLQNDADAIIALCKLLEVHDVETPVVAAPPKLQDKRTKRGKVPFYDYHVLRIGGETWDTPHVSSGTGEGRRSHLRRGHIRRLEGKTVWVRATYVHGSKDGFLHKDYEVIPPKKGPTHAVREQAPPVQERVRAVPRH